MSASPPIVASIQVGGVKQLGWFRFVIAPRAGETIEIMDPVCAVDVYRVLEVMHAPQPYVHGEEPLTKETLHLTVEWVRLDTDRMDRDAIVAHKLAEIEEALKRERGR
jgi:hypothetical protein